MSGLKILLLVDFFITGSAAEACSKALRKASVTDADAFKLAQAGITADTGACELEMELAGMVLGEDRFIILAPNHQNTNGRRGLRESNERKIT